MQLKIESLLKCLIVAQTAEKVLFGLDVRFVHMIPQFCRRFKAYNLKKNVSGTRFRFKKGSIVIIELQVPYFDAGGTSKSKIAKCES